jgi:hypothetical protein
MNKLSPACTKIALLLLCSLSIPSLFGQTLKGKVLDKDENPVQNAAVYIRELAQGIATDDRGEFQISIKSGTYTFDFTSLGYEKKTLPVTIDKPAESVSVVLDTKVYTLKEVVVTNKGEDPAYPVMRKAIAMAPYYLHQVKAYESEEYMKGTMKVDKIPTIVKLSIKDVKIKDLIQNLYVIEKQTAVSYTSPDKYVQKTLAESSSIPAEFSIGGMGVTSNIYNAEAFDVISPLAPNAFTYYKFKYEGITQEGEHWVNKIRVLPKKKNMELASGWIYIVEGSWNVQNVDLAHTEFGITEHVKVSYNEVRPTAFLPTAYDINVDANVMGLKGNVKYYSSIRYKSIDVRDNRNIPAKNKPQATEPETAPKLPTPKQQKAQQQLEVLSAKENLSNKDAYKMAKLVQDLSEPEESRKRRDTLLLLPKRSNFEITVDSLAKSRDSLYWEEIRDLPLRDEEMASYRRKDSLEIILTEMKSKDSTEYKSPKFSFGDIVMGDRIKLGKKYSLQYGGLLGAIKEYNFVDGFWLGQRLTFGMDINKQKSFSISPSVYYVTARQTVNWQIDGNYKYAPLRNGKLTISGGNTTADFKQTDGGSRIINSVTALLFAESPINFYQKKFLEATNQIDLSNGLILTTGLAYEKWNALDNKLSFSFFGGRPSPNRHFILYGRTLVNSAAKVNFQLSYTPRNYYRLSGGRKQYVSSDYPTFTLRYEKAIPIGGTHFASYDRLEAGIEQEVKLNIFDKINYFVNAGAFLTSKKIGFPDYKHFQTAELYVTNHSLNNSFSLLNEYANSTSKQWLQTHFTYTSSYLLVKNLPFLQNYLFDEALHVRSLWKKKRNYVELGYSVGFDEIGRVGVFMGSNKGKYLAVGFTVSIPILP